MEIAHENEIGHEHVTYAEVIRERVDPEDHITVLEHVDEHRMGVLHTDRSVFEIRESHTHHRATAGGGCSRCRSVRGAAVGLGS
jgi:hypothetical protein